MAVYLRTSGSRRFSAQKPDAARVEVKASEFGLRANIAHIVVRINNAHTDVLGSRENPMKSTSDTPKRPVNRSIHTRTLDRAKGLPLARYHGF